MPIYEFLCQNCGHEFERILPFSAQSTPSCPQCKSDHVVRQMGRPAIHFKGSGWYINDSKTAKDSANGSADKATDKTPASTETSTSATENNSKSDAKVDAKSESKSETKSDTKEARAAVSSVES
jgi:putative FmdB family regulatory protein